MNERWSVASRLRPAVTYLTVWLSASMFAVVMWASTAGAQEPYRGSLPVAPSSTVTTGDAFSPAAVVFVELDARVTITVFADRSCDRLVASNTFDLSGLETSGPPVTIDAPGQYYARSQVDDGPLSNCERLVEVVDEPALEVSQDGDTLRATSNLRGVVTAVLMEPGCTGGALGSTQWRADARTSQSPPLAAPPGRPAASVQVILSGDSGRTVTTCMGWASKTSQATTTTADPTVQEEGVIAARPAERTSTTLLGSGGPLAEATPVSPTTTTGSTTTAASTTSIPQPTVAGAPDLAETGPSRAATTAAGAGALLLLAGALTVLISRQTNKERGTS